MFGALALSLACPALAAPAGFTADKTPAGVTITAAVPLRLEDLSLQIE